MVFKKPTNRMFILEIQKFVAVYLRKSQAFMQKMVMYRPSTMVKYDTPSGLKD
jgi:hypothetical protein